MSNCFFFAIWKWFRHGGYLVLRVSKIGPWIHFIWCKDLKDAEIEHYVPIHDSLKVESVSKIFFKGEVRKKD